MINEEINKIKYLFGYKPGVVISEQTTPTTSGTTPTTSGTTPTTSGTTPTTTTTPNTPSPTPTPKKITEKELKNLRDCSGYKSGGKLTKGQEVDDYIIFNSPNGKPACKKPKEKK